MQNQGLGSVKEGKVHVRKVHVSDAFLRNLDIEIQFIITLTCSGGSRIYLPDGVANPKEGGANLLFWLIFPESCMKIKKILDLKEEYGYLAAPLIPQC